MAVRPGPPVADHPAGGARLAGAGGQRGLVVPAQEQQGGQQEPGPGGEGGGHGGDGPADEHDSHGGGRASGTGPGGGGAPRAGGKDRGEPPSPREATAPAHT